MRRVIDGVFECFHSPYIKHGKVWCMKCPLELKPSNITIGVAILFKGAAPDILVDSVHDRFIIEENNGK